MSFTLSTVATIAGIVAAAGTTAGVAYSIYASENAPGPKLPTTQRQRSNQIESKLVPDLQKKLQAENAKKNPDRDVITKLNQDIQDLQDEDALLLKSLGEAHAAAQGISGKDVAATPPVVAPAPAKRKIDPNVLVLSGGALVAVSIVGVAALVAHKRKK